MELRLVSVIENDFINATLLGIQLDVLQSFADRNDCELRKSLQVILINLLLQ